MKKLLFSLGLAACALRAVALPSFDPFADATANGGTSYANGSQLGHQTNGLGEGWASVGTSSSGTAVIIVNSNLVYSGFPADFPAPSGNAVQMTSGTGPGARLDLSRTVGRTPSVTNKVFVSFLMKVANISGLSAGVAGTAGVWFGGFNNTLGDQTSQPSAVGTRLYLRRDTSSSTTYYVGVQNNLSGTSAAGVVWDAGGHTINDVLFIVADYEYYPSGGTSDLGRLWVNPSSTTFGASTPPAGSLDYLGDSVSAIKTFALQNRNSAEPKVLLVDEVRIGDTWGYVTGGPGIWAQPASVGAAFSSNVTFQVQALSGSGTEMSYQWQKDGVNLVEGGKISGSTSSNLMMADVTQDGAGTYTVVVSNQFGTITSTNAELTVLDPYITLDPTNQSGPPGGSVTFSVAVLGTPTLRYQWRQNGLNLVDGVDPMGTTVFGSQSTNLVLSTLAEGDDGSTYDCVVDNGVGGEVVSSAVGLTIFDPAITAQPQSRTNDYGTTASFSVSVIGSGPFAYQWLKYGSPLTDGLNISGATSATLTLSGVSYLDRADYSVAVTNAAGSTAFSSSATLTVNDPIILTQPTNQSAGAGATVTFTVVAAGSPDLNYQWFKGSTPLSDGGNISGAWTSILALTNVSVSDAGSYMVQVNGTGGWLYSGNASLTVGQPPVITTPPQPRTVRAGSNVGFVMAATGTAPLSYQWNSNGVPIDGAASTSLALTNVQSSSTYSVIVSNVYGTTATGAVLTVSAGLLHLAPTNVLVARVGDGVQTLVADSGNTLSFDQFTPDGTYVSTVVIPDRDGSALIVDGSGNGGNSGSVLSLSANQRVVSFAGYNVSRPYTAGSGTMSSDSGIICPRGIGTVNGLGYYSLAVSDATLYGAYQFRSAVSTDGVTNFWTAGNGRGVKYVAPLLGPDTQISSPNSDPGGSPGNNRVVSIFGGNLYVATAYGSFTNGLWRFDGIPTTRTDPVQIITNASPSEFAVSPDGNTIYIADDTSIANGGGLQRWDNAGGLWTLTYTLGTGAGSTLGARGLAVDFSQFTAGPAGLGAVLYATVAGGSANNLIRVVDNGAGSVPTVIANAGINQMFRGVKFCPSADPAAIAAAPVNQTNAVGSTATFLVTANGSAPLSYQWLRQGTNLVDAGNISGSTTATLTISNVSMADAASYSVIVTNDLRSQTSSSATLTVVAPTAPHFDSWTLLPDKNFQMFLSGTVGLTYRIEGSTNLEDWVVLTNIFDAAGPLQFIDLEATNFDRRFYRSY